MEEENRYQELCKIREREKILLQEKQKEFEQRLKERERVKNSLLKSHQEIEEKIRGRAINKKNELKNKIRIKYLEEIEKKEEFELEKLFINTNQIECYDEELEAFDEDISKIEVIEEKNGSIIEEEITDEIEAMENVCEWEQAFENLRTEAEVIDDHLWQKIDENVEDTVWKEMIGILEYKIVLNVSKDDNEIKRYLIAFEDSEKLLRRIIEVVNLKRVKRKMKWDPGKI